MLQKWIFDISYAISHTTVPDFFYFSVHTYDEKMCTYLQIFIYRVCAELGTRSIHLHTVIPVSNLDVHNVIVALRNN
jgi:hypothetical protein